MSNFRNITGLRSGRLVAVNPLGSRGSHKLWLCKCDCGTERVLTASDLRANKSCGCWRREFRRKHGQSDTPIFNIWKSMRQRCRDPKDKEFKNYGGRGIAVCERWLSFQNFFDDMGERPPGMSLDRIDNDGNYEPDNCRWATPREQRANQRKSLPCAAASAFP